MNKGPFPTKYADKDIVKLNMKHYWPEKKRVRLLPEDCLGDRNLDGDEEIIGQQIRDWAMWDMVKYMKTNGTATWDKMYDHLSTARTNYPNLTRRQWKMIKDDCNARQYIEPVPGERNTYQYMA